MGREQNTNTEADTRRIIPFYAVALGDLIVPKARIEVLCGFCSRKGVLDVVELAARFGPRTKVREIETRLRCQQCGMRGWASFSLKWL